jgi:hypothetical protein
VGPDDGTVGKRRLTTSLVHWRQTGVGDEDWTLMPRVSAFYGIAIYMYWNERDHPVPHFHVYQSGRRASVSADGSVLAGDLEPRAYALVMEWSRLHREELLANWERARQNQPLVGIAPLP